MIRLTFLDPPTLIIIDRSIPCLHVIVQRSKPRALLFIMIPDHLPQLLHIGQNFVCRMSSVRKVCLQSVELLKAPGHIIWAAIFAVFKFIYFIHTKSFPSVSSPGSSASPDPDCR